MKVLLTGITGNLGFEIARILINKNESIIPIVLDKSRLDSIGFNFKDIIETDLTNNKELVTTKKVDCIIHSAGTVNFIASQKDNLKMMRSVISIAKKINVPVFYVSTAFLYRAKGEKGELRNAYEIDKYHAENLLKESGVPHTIFRPSVIGGNSKTGDIRNFSGYYILVKKFLDATKLAQAQNRKVRFPLFTGTSNMVPVDQVANIIIKSVLKNNLNKLVYITNPTPPKASWVLSETLRFFERLDYIDLIECSFEEYEKLEKTAEEEILYAIGKHMHPYWSLPYNFPESACEENLIDKKYLQNVLHYYEESNTDKK